MSQISQNTNWLPIITGRAWCFGEQIDTDLLAPGAYMKKPIEELARHCLEAINPEFAKQVQAGDVIVAGAGFGIGSSREQAAQALKILGISCVIATSFARIFYRNAINLGLPVLLCDTKNLAQEGDQISCDLSAGLVSNISKSVQRQGEPMPAFLQEILADGGLLANIKKRRLRSA